MSYQVVAPAPAKGEGPRPHGRVSMARKTVLQSQGHMGTHCKDDGAGATRRKSRRRRSGLASLDDNTVGSGAHLFGMSEDDASAT